LNTEREYEIQEPILSNRKHTSLSLCETKLRLRYVWNKSFKRVLLPFHCKWHRDGHLLDGLRAEQALPFPVSWTAKLIDTVFGGLKQVETIPSFLLLFMFIYFFCFFLSLFSYLTLFFLHAVFFKSRFSKSRSKEPWVTWIETLL